MPVPTDINVRTDMNTPRLPVALVILKQKLVKVTHFVGEHKQFGEVLGVNRSDVGCHSSQMLAVGGTANTPVNRFASVPTVNDYWCPPRFA